MSLSSSRCILSFCFPFGFSWVNQTTCFAAPSQLRRHTFDILDESIVAHLRAKLSAINDRWYIDCMSVSFFDFEAHIMQLLPFKIDSAVQLC